MSTSPEPDTRSSSPFDETTEPAETPVEGPFFDCTQTNTLPPGDIAPGQSTSAELVIHFVVLETGGTAPHRRVTRLDFYGYRPDGTALGPLVAINLP